MSHGTAGARRLLLERGPELRTADEALAELAGPGAHGGLLALAGPAGLGKTILLAEIRRRAVALGCTVLAARGGEQEQGVPFHVVRQLVQPVLAAATEDERHGMLGSWYGIVGPAVGLVAAEGSSAPDPHSVRDGLDWVVTNIAVRHTPVVLVVDDAHWADSDSLAWLTAFAPRAEDLPMLVLVAYRPDELPSGSAGPAGMAARGGTRPLELPVLTPAAVGALVREAAGPAAEEAFCRECWEVTGGNPFEATELAAKIRERGLEPVAASITELRSLASDIKGSGLARALERLGPSTGRFAWAAAVLGTEVSPSLAAHVAGLGEAEAEDAARRLREARVLTGSRTLEFVHPLIATAVYRSIPAAVRIALHGQAAAAVVDAGCGPTAAARHLMEMHPDSDPWVVRQLRAAAGESLRAGSPESARRCLARALREPPPFEDRAAVLFELGCASLLTEPATTVNHLRAALDEPGLTPELRQSVICRLAQALAHNSRLAEASELLAAEIERTEEPRTRLRLQVEKFMWDAFYEDESAEAAESRFHRLDRLAVRFTGHTRAEQYILGLRAWEAVVRGETAATALEFAERALGSAFHWADEDWGFEVPVLVAMVFVYCDQPGRSEKLFAAGIAEFERRGWHGAHLSLAYTLLGSLRFHRGRLVEAEELVRKGLRVSERVGLHTAAQWYAVGALIEILLACGRVTEAAELVERYSFADPFSTGVVFPDSQSVYGQLMLALGDRPAAVRHLRAAGERLGRRDIRNPAWSRCQLHLAVALAAEDPGTARTIADEAVRRARAFGAPSGIGNALRVTASLTDGAEALCLLDEAVRHLEQSPAAYELARALTDHGAALRRAGHFPEAADQLHRAVETAVACRSEVLADRAREELDAAGLRPRSPGPGTADTLTEVERRVAESAARGLTGEQIAVELGLEEKSAIRVLSAVCTKTGTDRAGLARLMRL